MKNALAILATVLAPLAAAEKPAVSIQAKSVEEASAGEAPDLKNVSEVLKQLSEGEASARLAGIETLRQIHFKPIPRDVSVALYFRAVDDEAEEVRVAAAKAIKALDDKEAQRFLVAGAVHPKNKEARRTNAANAIRVVDEPALVQAIVTMVSYDVRTGTAQPFTVPNREVAIQNPAIPIFLFIELPDLELRSVSTSLATYGVIALKTISRRDLGNDPKAWEKWFEEWKQVRQVRLAQEK